MVVAYSNSYPQGAYANDLNQTCDEVLLPSVSGSKVRTGIEYLSASRSQKISPDLRVSRGTRLVYSVGSVAGEASVVLQQMVVACPVIAPPAGKRLSYLTVARYLGGIEVAAVLARMLEQVKSR